MNTYLKVVLVLFAFICCVSCTNYQAPCCPNEQNAPILRNTQFNHKTVLSIRVGMPLDEFERIFGPPDRSSYNASMTPSKRLIYQYDMGKHPEGPFGESFLINKFYFTAENEQTILSEWDLGWVY